MGFCIADEELELAQDGIPGLLGGTLSSGKQTAELAPARQSLYSHFRLSDCTQVKSTTQQNPDAVRNAAADALKIFLHLCKFLSGESRCVWLMARGGAGRSWGHKVVSWGGRGVSLPQPAAAKHQ